MRPTLICAAISLLAMPAYAGTLQVSLTGVLTEQTSSGIDPSPYRVGSTIKMTARFGDKYFAQTPSGYIVAGLYGLPTSGGNYFKIDSVGGRWGASDDKFDGGDFYTYEYNVPPLNGSYTPFYKTLETPGLFIRGGKIVGVSFSFVGGPIPDLKSSNFGSGYGGCYNIDAGDPAVCYDTLSDNMSFTSAFSLLSESIYVNTYYGPEFNGEWDFSSSSVTAVPEPGIWTMLILGFGFTGLAVRCGRSATLMRHTLNAA